MLYAVFVGVKNQHFFVLSGYLDVKIYKNCSLYVTHPQRKLVIASVAWQSRTLLEGL